MKTLLTSLEQDQEIYFILVISPSTSDYHYRKGGQNHAKRKRKGTSIDGTKRKTVKATTFANGQFLVFLLKNRSKRLYFAILGATCQSVSWDKDGKKRHEEKQTSKLHQNRCA